jgi:hypothetical protein
VIVAWKAPLVSAPSFWNQSTDALTQALGSGTAGLATEEANRRLSVNGPNDAAAPKRRPAWQRFLVLFANPLVIILLFASTLSAITGDTASFVIVVTIVVLSVVMDFVQEMRAQNAVDALQAKVALRARAVRGGQEVTVLVAEPVPGDLVKLRAGDLVPADGRLLAASESDGRWKIRRAEEGPVGRLVSVPALFRKFDERFHEIGGVFSKIELSCSHVWIGKFCELFRQAVAVDLQQMSVRIPEIDALRNSVIDCGDDLDPVPLEVSIGGVQVRLVA